MKIAWRRTAPLARGLLAAGLAGAFYAWAVEPHWIEVSRHTVSLPIAAPLRIVHLSDLHAARIGWRERRVVERVRAEAPDLVVITGDTVAGDLDRDVHGREAAAVRELLGGLRAKLGVYAVLGNWEYWRGLAEPSPISQGTSVRWLVDDAAEIRPGLWLVGLDDACAGSPQIAAAFRRVPAGATAITILHSPAPFTAGAPRSALWLAGHSHGGQVRLPFLPPFWLPPETEPYVEGWYAAGGSRLFVSRGIGTTVLPIRFLCRPEIAVIDVVPAGARQPSARRASSRAAA